MVFAELTASVSGIDSITKKKLELCSGKSGVQLFFMDKPDPSCSICVMPVEMLPGFFSSEDPPSFLKPPVLGFGPPQAMNLSLLAGCIDYLCTPWSPEEFFIRMDRCLKMSSFCYKELRCFLRNGEVVCIGDDGLSRAVKLSNSENIILTAFCRNKGHFFSRKVLSELLLNSEEKGSRAVDMSISRLRSKIAALSIESESGNDLPVRTARGQGWGLM